jgi:hypothetical protein
VKQPEASQQPQTLSRELSVFLVQFSISLHKVGAYPANHPVVTESVESMYSKLVPLLAERGLLTLGVARNQLIVEGTATDPDSAVLADLAERLHRHQIGALRLLEGLSGQELHDLLTLLSSESGRDEVPLGLRPKDEIDRWHHIEVVPLTFEELQLSDSESDQDHPGAGGQQSQLWLGLAAAAMRVDVPEDDLQDGPSLAAEDIAAAIAENRDDHSYDRVIVGYLSQLGHELKLRSGAEAKRLHEQVTQLLQSLDYSTLKRLLEVGGDRKVRNRMLEDFSASLPVQAVLDLVKAAADADEQNISHSLIRMLSKLADHADASHGLIGPHADDGFRDSIQALLDGWNLEDPNPETYTEVLQHLSLAETGDGPGEDTQVIDLGEEAVRIVQMGLELDAVGLTVTHAVDTMLEEGRFTELLELVDGAPEASSGSAAIWEYLASPERVRMLLAQDEQDIEGVQRVLERLGAEATEPLINALASAKSRAMRHRLLSTLTALGSGVGPIAMAHLPEAEWFVQRNLLILIGSLTDWPEGFTPEPYAANSDARVRREAVKLMLQSKDLSMRDEGIQLGLADDDESIVRMALTTAINGCPQPAQRRAMDLMDDDDGDIRVLATRVVGTFGSTRAREVLIQRTLGKRRWWQRRPRLATPDPEMLTALSALATHWAEDASAADILDLARRSGNQDVVAAVGDA